MFGSSWQHSAQPFAGTASANGAGLAPGSPRHTVLPPPAGADQAPEEPVAVPETSLIDIIICDHRHTLTLLNHFTLAAAQGNTHAMELLSGALALDIRLLAQAMLDVMYPLLGRRYGGQGAELAGRAHQQLQAVERDALEMLTFRRERDWAALARRVDLTHKDFAGHVHEVEVGILPRLAADMKQEELVSAGLLFQQQKQTAPLVPDTGASAFTAAATVGLEAASVLGGPMVAGEYQQHTHSTHKHSAHAAPGGGDTAMECPADPLPQQRWEQQWVQQQQPQQQQQAGWQQQQQQPQLPIATPDKVVTPSQQLLLEEEM